MPRRERMSNLEKVRRSMDMRKIIQASSLSRNYTVAKKRVRRYLPGLHSHKTIYAVKNISFEIGEGETVGFIGPNGAGKSTTIKMLAGILHPTAGNVEVLGREPYKYRRENAKQIGAVFGQKSQLWWDLPVIDTYTLLKKIYKIPDKTYDRNLESYTECLQMKEFLHQPVRQLSLGQRMRAELCAALLHDPALLFLDEPTIGLDLVVKKQIREMIRRINQERNTTILLTTHDLRDIEEVCDRIILINHGEIIVDGELQEVRKNFEGFHAVEFLCKIPFREDIELPGVEKWKAQEGSFTAFYRNEEILPTKIIETVLQSYLVEDIRIKEPSIEEIVEKYYRE